MAATILDMEGWLQITAISVVIGIVSQAGDLVESRIKRHFGKKYTSGIIPGHGGLLDRIDGLLAATLLVGVLSATEAGSVLKWG